MRLKLGHSQGHENRRAEHCLKLTPGVEDESCDEDRGELVEVSKFKPAKGDCSREAFSKEALGEGNVDCRVKRKAKGLGNEPPHSRLPVIHPDCLGDTRLKRRKIVRDKVDPEEVWESRREKNYGMKPETTTR